MAKRYCSASGTVGKTLFDPINPGLWMRPVLRPTIQGTEWINGIANPVDRWAGNTLKTPVPFFSRGIRERERYLFRIK
jgi:hypothetical protein